MSEMDTKEKKLLEEKKKCEKNQNRTSDATTNVIVTSDTGSVLGFMEWWF